MDNFWALFAPTFHYNLQWACPTMKDQMGADTSLPIIFPHLMSVFKKQFAIGYKKMCESLVLTGHPNN